MNRRNQAPADAPLGVPSEPIAKPVDAWWTVLAVDPIATRLAAGLGRFAWVSPSGMTLVAHAMGVVTAVLFARGDLVAAAVLFELRFVIDCADGKLARARRQTSEAGRYLDYIGDYLVVAANAVGIALYLGWRGELQLQLGLALPVMFLVHIAAGQARDAEAGQAGIDRRASAQQSAPGYRRWMAARRLRTVPSRIEVEHALFFIAPIAAVLTDTDAVVVVVGAVATLFFAYRAARLLGAGYLIARQRDGRETG